MMSIMKKIRGSTENRYHDDKVGGLADMDNFLTQKQAATLARMTFVSDTTGTLINNLVFTLLQLPRSTMTSNLLVVICLSARISMSACGFVDSAAARTKVPSPSLFSLSASSLSLPDYSDAVRVVSWNVLCPEFATRKKYPWSQPVECLDWSGFREPLIISKLHEANADIICLQEVPVQNWSGFMHEFAKNADSHKDDHDKNVGNYKKARYEGIIQNVTKNHPYANAIIFRKDRFRVLRCESRSRALLAVLQQRYDHSTTPLYLACAHLLGGGSPGGTIENETRIRQLRSLLNRLEHHSKMDGQKIRNANPNKQQKNTINHSPIIIAGDLNIIPTNPIYHWLQSGNSTITYNMNTNTNTRKGNAVNNTIGRKRKGGSLPLQSDSPSTSASTATFAGMQNNGVRKQRFPQVSFLPLRDSYHETPPTVGELSMTYSGGSVLDYIWTSAQVRIIQTLILNEHAIRCQQQPWPSIDHPSDHLPIGADIQWEKKQIDGFIKI